MPPVSLDPSPSPPPSHCVPKRATASQKPPSSAPPLAQKNGQHNPNMPASLATASGKEEDGQGEIDEEDEEDYLSMSIMEPEKPKWKKETYSEIRRRKEREAEQKGRTKSKKELALEETARREAALAKPLPTTSNRGAAMMAKLGYKPGDTLGVSGGRSEPLELSVKEGRGGVGMDSERKRKFREDMAREAEVMEQKKKREAEEGVGFRERVALEREERRVEGLWWGGMRVAEGLEEDDDGEWEGPTKEEMDGRRGAKRRRGKTHLLWRVLDRDRREKKQERLAQRNLTSRLSDLNEHDSDDEDGDEKTTYGTVVEDDDLGADEELEAFLGLPVKERLDRLLQYLRKRWHYCFWCKMRYPNEEMEECPGTSEDDHG